MFYAGIDVGSTTIKVALFDGEQIFSSSVVPSGINPAKTAESIFEKLLSENSLRKEEIGLISATGYGRRLLKFANVIVTEIKACAFGAYFLSTPTGKPKTVIDVGGQDTKVILLDEDGKVANFAMNDKCAAGTGRFLEMLAYKLEMSYEDFVQIAEESKHNIQMNSTCAVFAESEVVSLLARGVSKADISAAAHNSIAERIAAMVRRMGNFSPPIFFAGGGAMNNTLKKALEKNLGVELYSSPQSQKTSAIGAAIFASQNQTE